MSNPSKYYLIQSGGGLVLDPTFAGGANWFLPKTWVHDDVQIEARASAEPSWPPPPPATSPPCVELETVIIFCEGTLNTHTAPWARTEPSTTLWMSWAASESIRSDCSTPYYVSVIGYHDKLNVHFTLLPFSAGPLFLIMPFPLLHQMFVLHSPDYECVPPEEISAQTLGINTTQWKVVSW